MDEKNGIIRKLHKCSEEISEEMGIDKVILFGSYVRNDITKDSDIDVLVIGKKKDRNIRTKIAIMFHKAIPKKPMDVLLKTKEDIDKRLEIGDSFIKNIIEKGVMIYERDYNLSLKDI